MIVLCTGNLITAVVIQTFFSVMFCSVPVISITIQLLSTVSISRPYRYQTISQHYRQRQYTISFACVPMSCFEADSFTCFDGFKNMLHQGLLLLTIDKTGLALDWKNAPNLHNARGTNWQPDSLALPTDQQQLLLIA